MPKASLNLSRHKLIEAYWIVDPGSAGNQFSLQNWTDTSEVGSELCWRFSRGKTEPLFRKLVWFRMALLKKVTHIGCSFKETHEGPLQNSLVLFGFT